LQNSAYLKTYLGVFVESRFLVFPAA